MNVIYPVGSIVVYSELETRSPSEIVGGEWRLLSGGRILALSKKVIDETAGKITPIGWTGGETDHTLTVKEMPEHEHKLATTPVDSVDKGVVKDELYLDGISSSSYTFWTETPSAGGSKSHENMPPYRVVSMWRRIK